MTKEELISLSDLNREDNIKYISSEAQGIAITLDSDRYAPTLCKLERAYICGRRKNKEHIAELEKENADLKELLEACKQERIEALYRNEQYIKENAELKKQLEMSNKVYNDNLDYSHHIEGQLTNARCIIASFVKANTVPDLINIKAEAEQLLKESEVEK